MDPTTLILTALAAGIQSTVGEAVKDAYIELKTLLKRKFSGKSVAETALTEYEKNPDIWKEPLAQELQVTRADQDQLIIAVAQKLIQLAQQGDSIHNTINIKGNAQGTIIGDRNTITQTFNASSEKQP